LKLTETGARRKDNVARGKTGGEWWVVAGDGMNWQTFDFGEQQP